MILSALNDVFSKCRSKSNLVIFIEIKESYISLRPIRLDQNAKTYLESAFQSLNLDVFSGEVIFSRHDLVCTIVNYKHVFLLLNEIPTKNAFTWEPSRFGHGRHKK